MKHLKNSQIISLSDVEQMPLPNMRIAIKTTNPKWRAWLEGKPNGGQRLIVTKNR